MHLHALERKNLFWHGMKTQSPCSSRRRPKTCSISKNHLFLGGPLYPISKALASVTLPVCRPLYGTFLLLNFDVKSLSKLHPDVWKYTYRNVIKTRYRDQFIGGCLRNLSETSHGRRNESSFHKILPDMRT